MKKRLFIKNAAILTATSLFLRTVGMVFRVYIAGRIGAEGMGLYQLIFSVYILATTFASAGISVAVTRLITDHTLGARGVRNIVRIAFAASVLLGAASGAALFGFSDFIAHAWLKDVRAAVSLRILAPALPFIAVSSCLRGYFAARRKVAVSSGAQIFEQLVRMGIIFVLLGRFSGGLEQACLAIVIGNTVSEALSCLYMYIGYVCDRRGISGGGQSIGRMKIIRSLFAIATPLAAGSYLNTTLHTAENLLVPQALTKYNHSKETSLAQFGMLKAMAMPILFFPASFLTSVATLLLPEVSESNARGRKENLRRTVGASMQISLLSSLLIAALMMIFAYPLAGLIYNSREVGEYIFLLAPVLPFMYIESIILGIMHGLNLQTKALKYNVIDSAVRISLIMLAVPYFGIRGFVWIMILSNVLTPVLNMRQLIRVTQVRMLWSKWVIRPLIAVAISGGAAYYLVYMPLLHMGGTLPMMLAMLFAAVVYVGLLVMMRCVVRGDFRRESNFHNTTGFSLNKDV